MADIKETMSRCCVSGCINFKRPNKDASVSFHSFPQNPEFREKWKAITGREDWTPTSRSRMCSKHFDNRDLLRTPSGLVLLRPNAIPIKYTHMERPILVTHCQETRDLPTVFKDDTRRDGESLKDCAATTSKPTSFKRICVRPESELLEARFALSQNIPDFSDHSYCKSDRPKSLAELCQSTSDSAEWLSLTTGDTASGGAGNTTVTSGTVDDAMFGIKIETIEEEPSDSIPLCDRLNVSSEVVIKSEPDQPRKSKSLGERICFVNGTVKSEPSESDSTSDSELSPDEHPPRGDGFSTQRGLKKRGVRTRGSTKGGILRRLIIRGVLTRGILTALKLRGVRTRDGSKRGPKPRGVRNRGGTERGLKVQGVRTRGGTQQRPKIGGVRTRGGIHTLLKLGRVRTRGGTQRGQEKRGVRTRGGLTTFGDRPSGGLKIRIVRTADGLTVRRVCTRGGVRTRGARMRGARIGDRGNMQPALSEIATTSDIGEDVSGRKSPSKEPQSSSSSSSSDTDSSDRSGICQPSDSDCSVSDDEHDHYDNIPQWFLEQFQFLHSRGKLINSPCSCTTPASGPGPNSSQTETAKTDNTPQCSTKSSRKNKKGKLSKSIHSRTLEVNIGSELESDFDDDSIKIFEYGGMDRIIPNSENLEEPVREVVDAVEKAMDDAVEELITGKIRWHEDFAWFGAGLKEFTGPTPGPIQDYDSPYQAFTHIWNDYIMDHIVKETNRYANEVIGRLSAEGKLKKVSPFRLWRNTNRDELYILFAVYVLMGLNPHVAQELYWTSTGYLEMPKFRKLMPYPRFVLLDKFLHFESNPESIPPLNGDDDLPSKYRKIAPVVRHLNARYSVLYNLFPELCIDESMSNYKKSQSWIESIKIKPSRFDMKSIELCDARSGYMYRFDIHPGLGKGVDLASASAALAKKSTNIIIDLLKGLEHRGHSVAMDSFYNCPSLARYLKLLGFDTFGTMRSSRNNVPLEIKNLSKTVSKGTMIARHSGDVSCIAWKDTKLVTMVSTVHSADMWATEPVFKPLVQRDYSYSMGMIELRDQSIQTFILEKNKCEKWYVKVFKRMLNTSIHNALVLFLRSLERRRLPAITQRDFREQLVRDLAGKHLTLSRQAQNPTPTETSGPPLQETGSAQPNTGASVQESGSAPKSDGAKTETALKEMRLRRDIVHIPTRLNRYNRGHCVVCNRMGKRKRAYLKCVTCNEYICEKCWALWHSIRRLPNRHDIQNFNEIDFQI